MNEYDIDETALKQVCNEIKDTIEKISKSGMNDQLLDRLDKLYHTKKDILTCHGMEHPDEYYKGSSGRYMSRDNGTYSDGYSRGYSEAMNQMNQPHQTTNPYYPEPRRW